MDWQKPPYDKQIALIEEAKGKIESVIPLLMEAAELKRKALGALNTSSFNLLWAALRDKVNDCDALTREIRQTQLKEERTNAKL